ncbi:MAG: hypothetical protein LUB59_06270 [Candidatus Gastranaerophilales bacterium]|nr:hypothetical protein [Candidatus Gastranaerophilales bacterium]
MGLFSSSKQSYSSSSTKASKEETAAKKARLVETEVGNNGSELSSAKGQSIRKIFGA